MRERLGFERELDDLGLREYDQAQPPAKRREVAIGEEIVLDLTSVASIATVRWTVPGTVVKYYVGNTENTQLRLLSKSDLEKPRLIFHWVDAGDNREVKARITYNHWFGPVTTESVLATFDVKAPTLDCFCAQTTKPMLLHRGHTWKISFGDKSRGAGINWDWKVTMHKNHGGFLKDIQTVKQGRKKLQLLRRGDPKTRTIVYRHPKKDVDWQLDQDPREGRLPKQGEPEAAFSTPGFFGIELPTKVEAGQTLRNNDTWDAPSSVLMPLDKSISVDESFKYYILYKPDKPKAIWVPIAKAEWFWQAEAIQRGDKSWVFRGKPKGGIRSPNGVLDNCKCPPNPNVGPPAKGAPPYKAVPNAATMEFPQYKANVVLNGWNDL